MNHLKIFEHLQLLITKTTELISVTSSNDEDQSEQRSLEIILIQTISRMNKIYYSIAIAVMTATSFLSAQTNPTPWNLNNAGNFSFTSLSPSASSFPSGMVVHKMGASPTTLSTSASANIPLPANQIQDSYTNVWANDAKGITIRSNPVSATSGYTSGQSAQVIVAVNTTSRNTVKVSFKAGTAGAASGQSATFKLRCQYRVGSSGTWLEMPNGTAEYQTLTTVDSVMMGPYTLPSTANNQSVVQVRWLYYYVSGGWSAQNNRSARAQLDDISITSQPNVSQTPFSPVCESASPFTLTGGSPAGGTYSGIGVVNGTTFDPALAGAGTYTLTYTYTDANGMSGSASQPITVMPKPTVVANASANPICFGSSTILTGSGASTYTWSGGVTNGSSFSPSTTSTYTVTGTDGNGCTNSAAITVTVNPKPNVSANASTNPVCSGNSTTLSGSGASSYVWTGGVSNGVAFTPSSTSSYTVTGTDNNGCVNSAAITVTVNPLPTVTANASANPICSGNSTTLTGGGASSYAWSGGVMNGVAFSPPSTASYTVIGTDANGCSNSTAITLTVNPTPTVEVSGTTTIYSGSSTTLTATGGTTYSWAPATNLDTAQGSMVVATPPVTTVYTVTGTTGSCSGAKIFTVTVIMGPTNLQPEYCGITETALNQVLYCVPVSNATYYKYEVTDQSNNSVVYYYSPNASNAFQMSWVSGVGYAKTYAVRIAAFIGSGWSAYGTICSVTTPPPPTTKLQAAYCGITETALNQQLSCDVVYGATQYRYEVTDMSNNSIVYYQSPNTSNLFQMSWVSGVAYNKTYAIRVAASAGGTWLAYGPSCTVTTPASSLTKLQNAYCGITETALNQQLACDVVYGASYYRYEVTDMSNSSITYYQSPNASNLFQMNWVSGVAYNRTYSIRVAAWAGGTLLAYGPSCTVTTPATSLTKLQNAYCGITETTLSQQLACDGVYGATNYQYEVTDLSNNSIAYYQSPNASNLFQMNWVPGVTTGHTYSVRVAAQAGGTWLSYGTACTVSTGAARMAGESALTETMSTSESSNTLQLAGDMKVELYPNPNPGKFDLAVSKEADVRISNVLGASVYNNRLGEGKHAIDLSFIQPGVYLVQVYDGKNSWLMRMIKE